MHLPEHRVRERCDRGVQHYRETSGSIRIDGQAVTSPDAQAAFSLGIATVFQEFSMPENLDVTSNIFLGRERIRGGLLDMDEMEDLARTYLNRLRSPIPDMRVPLNSLSAGQRQCVAIARTLITDPRIVILDEPTASLSVVQTAEVLSYVESLREMGLGVILISHNLTDLLAVADRVEVLRHGRNNGSFPTSSAGYEEILSAITGATRHPKRSSTNEPELIRSRRTQR